MRILSILLLLVASQCPAQKFEATNHILYNITVSVDHISYPGNKKYRPKHTRHSGQNPHTGWGISAGVDIPFSKSNSHHFQLQQSFKVGYLNNSGIQHAIRFYTEPSVLYKLSSVKTQLLQTGVQLGYMRVYPKGGMISNQQEKVYINHSGRGQFTGGFLLGCGYRFQNNSVELQNSLQYHFWLQGPFINGLAPILPHQSVSFSSSFHL
ncbi:MAG: hypothetical protein ABJA71_16745 [Ginsengibacter sp.]